MQTTRQEKAKEIIDRIPDLATLPAIYTKISSMMEFPSTTTGDLERVIKNDQVLTSKLLKLVNSSFYGFSRKIDSVADAIVLLGFSVLRNLIVTSSIFKYAGSGNDSVGAAVQKLWTHSINCGVAAKLIAGKTDFPDTNGAFSGGILHDIGKVMICQYLRKEFKEIVMLAAARDISNLEAEECVLGINHCDLGKCFAEKCNLPENLIEVIAHHHSPSDASISRELVAIIHIADAVNNHTDFMVDWHSTVEKIEAGAFEILGFIGEAKEQFLAELRADIEEVNSHTSEPVA